LLNTILKYVPNRTRIGTCKVLRSEGSRDGQPLFEHSDLPIASKALHGALGGELFWMYGVDPFSDGC
jgi:hypothetical protein